MNANKIQELVNGMDPKEAASAIGKVMKNLFPLLDEEVRLKFTESLAGESAGDKLASMVHYWLAECMDEGVDPTHLSRGLMDKVARSKQLMAVADPEVLVLFEDWLEEMETEVEMHAKKTGSVNPDDIANGLGLSRSGARFLIAKLRREGKL